MTMPDTSRDIEEVISHQGQQIDELNEVVLRQWKEIDLLKSALKKLQGKIEQLDSAVTESEGAPLSVTEQAARDKPPHY